ncbi:MAG: hemin uptake protein HemP [Planctomycetaceae bacterium]|nr:hemin uptake protein HemP [Planctomycetaceae bacterium]
MTCDQQPSSLDMPDPQSASATPAANTLPSRAVSSEDLFQGGREVLIVHAGETYRLRLTRNGKLILNK